jgi:UDP-glucose 4-epimerase
MTRPGVAITGAGGFIGRAVLPALQRAGYEVLPIHGLADDPAWLQATGCAAVIHLANIAHARASLEALQQVNVQGTRAVAQRALKAGVPRFVYVSSIKVHGEESPPEGFSADSPINPAERYGEAKARAEQALQALARADGLQLSIVRPPLVYGPHVKANFLALMKAVAHGWPLPFARVANRRSLVYVANLADALIQCSRSERAVGRAFPVSDGVPVSTAELCRALGHALGRPARLFAFPQALIPMPGLTRSLVVDDSAIRRELGWKPPFSFDEGLSATAAWYRSR